MGAAFFTAQLAVLGFFTAAVALLSRLNIKSLSLSGASNSSADASGSTLPRRYLVVYGLMMASDWLQGPYMYHLLNSEHRFAPSDISTLFVIGFSTGAVSSPWIGKLADVYGRRFMCYIFCLLYAISCTLICTPSWTACVLARVAGGLATSILFSVPESWLVSTSHQEDVPATTLSNIFGSASFLNGLVAVVCGVFSNIAVDKTGTAKTPFRLATVILALVAVLLRTTWSENFGATRSTTRSGSIQEAAQAIRQDSNLYVLLSTQTIFETTMYIFVFLWVPVMESKAAIVSHHLATSLPLGIIFSSFMCCMMLGSLLYTYICKHSAVELTPATGTSTNSYISTDPPILLHARIIGLLTLVAAAAIGVSNDTDHVDLIFWAFCLFEATVGVYYPAVGWLRSELISDEVRATFASLFRVPLNTLVTLSLLVGVEDRRVVVFYVCTIALAVASGLVNWSLVRKFKAKAPAPLDLQTK